MMKCDTNIINYLNNNYNNFQILDILNENMLYYKFADQFIEYNKEDKEKTLMINRMMNFLNLDISSNIFSDIEKMNIEYISFKGLILSQLLYNNPCERAWGDIDFFVNSQYFDKMISYLLENGFELVSENGLLNQHHVVFMKDGLPNQYPSFSRNNKIFVELHKNIFNPNIGINEDYLRNNLNFCEIRNHKITTFNKTASILHLIYHLYMDTCLSPNNIYAISTKTTFGTANRFLYRAYEIALFAEKYFKDIKWNDIISDLKTQKLRIVFKYMVEDILEIFPNAFPAKLVDAINTLEYVSEQNDDIYKIIRAAKAEHDNNVDLVLSKYIDENWNYNNTATCKHLGECFEISKPVGEEPCENKTLSCELLIDRCEKGISLRFTVSDDDFYVSDCNNFGTLESDGVHLLLCGTQKYTYMSIFLVPKIKNNSIEVFAYDVLNNTVIDSMDIQARIQKYDDYYVLQAVLSNEFLSKHEIDKYFYGGFVISDCDRETKYRKNALVSAEPATEWYNPLHFLKIDLLDY